MDVELELRRVLRERSTAAPAADVVGAVHRGMVRRQRRQRFQTGAVALSVVAVAVSTALVLRPAPNADPLVTTQLNQTVPAGFEVSDLTWTSTSEGYALGTVPCPAKPCTVVLRTDTGGNDWVRRTAPPAAVVARDGVLPEGCGTGTCIGHLRFAEDADGNEVGYAYGPGFAVSRDGAASWAVEPAPGAVEAVEAARQGTVVRVLARPGGGHLVQQAPVGGVGWTTVLDLAPPSSRALLKRQADRLLLLTDDVRVSLDGGSTWTTGAHDPCAPGSDPVGAALGKEHQVLVLCTRAGSASDVRESRDDGATFGPPVALPAGVTGRQLVAPSKGGWLVDVAGASERAVLDSRDDGRTWDTVMHERRLGAVVGEGYLDNSSSKAVWWVGPDARVVWRSTDAGDSWTSATFR